MAADEGKAQSGGLRVAGIPWSAPLFDKQAVVSNPDPDLYCASMINEDGSKRCTCITEQGTHADVPGAVCFKVAEDGVYNPYRKPLADSASSSVGKVGDETLSARSKLGNLIGSCLRQSTFRLGGPSLTSHSWYLRTYVAFLNPVRR